MLYYSYTARGPAGALVKGVLEANNADEFFKELDERELICIDYRIEKSKAKKSAPTTKLSSKELILFCKKMGTMISAGISITGSLDLLIGSATNNKTEQLYRRVYESVRSGMPLSEAMMEQGESFTPLFNYMVQSGEESGNIDSIFLRMSDYYEKQLKTNRKIKSATSYPKMLGIVALGVIVALFGFVLPELFVMFEGMELPALTSFMISISNIVTQFWPILIILAVLLFFLTRTILQLENVVYFTDKIQLKTPLIGRLTKMIYSGRFSSTLSLLYAAGLPLLDTLRLSTNVINNRYMAEKLELAMRDVSSGVALSKAVSDIGIFDSMLPSMIAVGEETGDLDGMLNTTAQYYEGESDSAIETILGILAPALLVVMAVVVAIILISVLVPIYNGYGTIATF